MRCANVESAVRTSRHAIFDVRYALRWWCVGETRWQHRPCLARKGFLALVRCARQGARFVDVARRRCIRWSFESPRLMYRFLSYIKRRASNGGVHQKLCGRPEKGDVGLGGRKPSRIEAAPTAYPGPVKLAAVRPKNGAARFAVLPSVEPWTAMQCQGRILKPRNKSARQNRPCKG